MSIVNDWQQLADEHANIAYRIRKVTEKRLSVIEYGLEIIDRQYGFSSGGAVMHPEMFGNYYYQLSQLVNLETIETITKTIKCCVEIERKATSLQYHDLNKVAAMLDQNGYRVVPKKSVGADREVSTGISDDTVELMRKSLGISVLGLN